MTNNRFRRSLISLLLPLILVLVGAGLAALGGAFGWLVLMIAGVVVAAAGVLWALIMLELANPFEWF